MHDIYFMCSIEEFYDMLISFTNKDGRKVSPFPFEIEEKYNLVRMTIQEDEEVS